MLSMAPVLQAGGRRRWDNFLPLEGFEKTVSGTTLALYFSSLPSKLRKKLKYICMDLSFFLLKSINCIKETLLQTL